MGKGYLCNGMFKLNVHIDNNNNSSSVSAYIVDSPYLWHNRLGHVNFKRIRDMVKLDLIPYIDQNHEKCTTCMLTKITRNTFPKIERTSNVLDLIHSDVCDMHSTPSLGGKILSHLLMILVDFVMCIYCILKMK